MAEVKLKIDFKETITETLAFHALMAKLGYDCRLSFKYSHPTTILIYRDGKAMGSVSAETATRCRAAAVFEVLRMERMRLRL